VKKKENPPSSPFRDCVAIGGGAVFFDNKISVTHLEGSHNPGPMC